MVQLEVLNSRAKGKKFRIQREITIGSAPSCSIRVSSEGMSPEHARISLRDHRPFLEVVDEEAHVFVNGRDVLSSELQHQDQIKIGPLRFKVIDEKVISSTVNRLDQLLDNLNSDDEVYDFATEDLFYLTNKDPALRKAINFKIPSRDRFIDQAQQFLARLIRQAEVDEMKTEAFMTCTKELILNAHRHGHEYDESKTIVIRYRDRGDHVQLTIEDEGAGFDHASILDKVRNLSPADAARLRYQEGGFGGLGFQMICRMSDSIEYNAVGNVVTFSVTKEF